MPNANTSSVNVVNVMLIISHKKWLTFWMRLILCYVYTAARTWQSLMQCNPSQTLVQCLHAWWLGCHSQTTNDRARFSRSVFRNLHRLGSAASCDSFLQPKSNSPFTRLCMWRALEASHAYIRTITHHLFHKYYYNHRNTLRNKYFR